MSETELGLGLREAADRCRAKALTTTSMAARHRYLEAAIFFGDAAVRAVRGAQAESDGVAAEAGDGGL